MTATAVYTPNRTDPINAGVGLFLGHGGFGSSSSRLARASGLGNWIVPCVNFRGTSIGDCDDYKALTEKLESLKDDARRSGDELRSYYEGRSTLPVDVSRNNVLSLMGYAGDVVGIGDAGFQCLRGYDSGHSRAEKNRQAGLCAVSVGAELLGLWAPYSGLPFGYVDLSDSMRDMYAFVVNTFNYAAQAIACNCDPSVGGG